MYAVFLLVGKSRHHPKRRQNGISRVNGDGGDSLHDGPHDEEGEDVPTTYIQLVKEEDLESKHPLRSPIYQSGHT